MTDNDEITTEDEKAAPGTEGYGETDEDDPSRSSEQQARHDGVTPPAEERAQMRESASDSAGLPEESPGLLGDRVADADR